MFSKRKSRQVSDAPYTGVSGIPGNRASTNAHAAASAIATALKESNGSAVNMKLPPTQQRSSSLLRASNSFRGSLRTNSINVGISNYSRSSSLIYQQSPMRTPSKSGHQHRLSLTPQSLKQLNDHNELRSVNSTVSSDYGDIHDPSFGPSAKTPNTKRHSVGVSHKVSFSDASSNISVSRAPPQRASGAQIGAPTRQRTIKKYVPSANGLVAVEVPVEEEHVRTASLRNSSRTSSLRAQRKPSAKELVSHQASQRATYTPIAEEQAREAQSVEQTKERLQKEREELEQRYFAKLEEEKLYQEKIKREKAAAEEAEKARLQEEYEDELNRQKQVEQERERVAAEAAAAETEASRLASLEREQLKAQEQASVAPVIVAETNPYSAEDGTLYTASESTVLYPVESVISQDVENGLIRELDDNGDYDADEDISLSENPRPEIVANGASSAELDLVNGYHRESNDSLSIPQQTNESSSRSNPTSAELSENLGTATDATEIDSSEDVSGSNSANNHLSMAKQLRSAMQAPPVFVNDEAVNAEQTPAEVPLRNERRLSGASSSQGAPLSRKKSALKQTAKYDTSPNKPLASAAAQAYLSLTTAENTRLNAMNTQSSLSLSQPDVHKKRVSQQPKSLRTAKPPSTPQSFHKQIADDPYNRPRPITINLPQQVSPGKFVLPKSEAKKKADALYKKANTKPRQREDDLRKNLPPLQRKSSFEKSREASTPQPQPQHQQQPGQAAHRLSMRPQHGQYEQNEYSHPPPQQSYDSGRPQVPRPFKSRFADSDSDDDFPAPPRHPARAAQNGGGTPSRRTANGNGQVTAGTPSKNGNSAVELEDDKKKKKIGGRLKKLFGRH